MSLISKLHDAFIEEDPALESAPTAAPVAPKVYQPPTGTVPVPSTTVGTLRSRIEVPGGAMLAFNAAMKSMAAYITDEGARIKAAKDVLASQGITVEDVVGQFNVAINSVALETTKFATAKAAKLLSDVTSVQSTCVALADQIKQHEAEIQKLVAQKTEAELKAAKSKAEIESREEQFTSESVSLRNEYEESLRKIQLYIGGTK